MKFNVQGGVTMETCLQCGGHTFIVLNADKPWDIGTDGLDHITVCATCGKTNILHSASSLDDPIIPDEGVLKGEEMLVKERGSPQTPLPKEEDAPIWHQYIPTESAPYKPDERTKHFAELYKNELHGVPVPPDIRPIKADFGARESQCESIAPGSGVRCNSSKGHKGAHHYFDKEWKDDPQDIEEHLNKCVVKAFTAEGDRGRENVIIPNSVPDPTRIIDQIFTAKEHVKKVLGHDHPKAYMAPGTFADMRQIGIVMVDGEDLTIAGVPIKIDTRMISGIVIEQEDP